MKQFVFVLIIYIVSPFKPPRDNIFIELIKMASKKDSFSFNTIMCRSFDEISMGSLLGHLRANIPVGFQEKQVTKLYPNVLYDNYIFIFFYIA